MSDLSNFLRKKQQEYEQEQINLDKVKVEWIQQVQKFMNQIQDWLKPLEQNGLLKVIEKETELEEEHIGKYKAVKLELIIGADRINIEPVGRFIIGALGRIDISSIIGNFIVIYHAEKGWIYRNEQQKTTFQPFTEENFTNIVKALV